MGFSTLIIVRRPFLATSSPVPAGYPSTRRRYDDRQGNQDSAEGGGRDDVERSASYGEEAGDASREDRAKDCGESQGNAEDDAAALHVIGRHQRHGRCRDEENEDERPLAKAPRLRPRRHRRRPPPHSAILSH
jgi:hypothetical protein